MQKVKPDRYFFQRFPAHPIFLAAYPTLALLATNVQEVEPWVALRPLCLCLLLGMLIYGLMRLLLKDWQRAALATALFSAVFYSYGHVYHLVEGLPVIGRHRVLAPLYLFLLAAGLWFILRRLKNIQGLNTFLNVASAAALVIPLVQVGAYQVRSAHLAASSSTKVAGVSALSLPAQPPDVYYIILDMYAREDVLRDEYGLDNRPFLDELREMGFYVADCSQSNYQTTEFSLASSLNMDYLQDLSASFSPQSTDRSELPELMVHSQVRKLFEAAGYRSVSFETGYYWDEWMDAGVYLAPTGSGVLLDQLRPFEAMLVQSTAGLALVDVQSVLFGDLIQRVNAPNGEHINRELFVLDKMENIATLAGPKLVFAHILIPHPPFVFAPDGSIREDENYFGNHGTATNQDFYRDGYTGQVEYINERILEIIKNILAQSRTPPIILLQGDHGVRGDHPLANLNAYYLPEATQTRLYASITPVNSFRLVLDQEFGMDLDLLPDTSYSVSATDPFPFNFTPVSDGSCEK